jgi:hypothetical protein
MSDRKFDRRQVLSMGAAAMGAVGATVVLGRDASATCVGVQNEGAGMYADATTAQQLSGFSITPAQITCQVGTVSQGVWTGPFAMSMISLSVDTYNADPTTYTITATGSMRSRTDAAGVTQENTDHSFIALGVDNHDSLAGAPDHFEIHFKTNFWNTTNPMCSPSPRVPGGCMFGGDLHIGVISVGPACDTTF